MAELIYQYSNHQYSIYNYYNKAGRASLVFTYYTPSGKLLQIEYMTYHNKIKHGGVIGDRLFEFILTTVPAISFIQPINLV